MYSFNHVMPDFTVHQRTVCVRRVRTLDGFSDTNRAGQHGQCSLGRSTARVIDSSIVFTERTATS